MLLLRYSLGTPKLLHNLSKSPCFLPSRLSDIDDLLKSILSHTLSINSSDAATAWVQAQLPVKLGAVRSECSPASAFLASAAGASDIVRLLLLERLNNISIPNVDMALTFWSQNHNASPPLALASFFLQKACDLSRSLPLLTTCLTVLQTQLHVLAFLLHQLLRLVHG